MKRLLYSLKFFPQLLFYFLMSFASSSYVIIIFLIKQKIAIPFLPWDHNFISYVLYLTIPLLIAYFCLFLSKRLPPCAMECQIREVELASHSFLPTYLGYFFVALSVPDVESFVYVYIVLFIFIRLSQSLSFNPLFLLFGYQFYFVTGKDGTKIFLISRQSMKPFTDAELDDLRRINDFTFLDMR